MAPKPAGKHLNLICPGRWRFPKKITHMKRLITILFFLLAVRLSATSVWLTYNGNPSLSSAVTCSVNDSLRQVTLNAFANLGSANIQIKRQGTITEVSTSVTLSLNDNTHMYTISTTQPNRYVITITLSDGTFPEADESIITI